MAFGKLNTGTPRNGGTNWREVLINYLAFMKEFKKEWVVIEDFIVIWHRM